MKQYRYYIIMLGVIIALIIAFNLALHRIKVLRANEGKIIRDTTIVVHYDTIKITKPVYISQKVIDTLLVPITDTLRQNDTLYVPIPKTQLYYAKDSLYQAWVSGYKPNLDSIKVFPKTIYTTITNTVYKKPARVTIGATIGYGAMYVDKQIKFGPTIVAGVQVKF